MKVLITDYDFPNLEIERSVLDAQRIETIAAQCRSEAEVIAAGDGCDALLVQYAPITERVLEALPALGIVSRYGAGYDTVDSDACRRHGVWLANSPDYGVGEVAGLGGTRFMRLSQTGYQLVAQGVTAFEEIEKAVGRS